MTLSAPVDKTDEGLTSGIVKPGFDSIEEPKKDPPKEKPSKDKPSKDKPSKIDPVNDDEDNEIIIHDGTFIHGPFVHYHPFTPGFDFFGGFFPPFFGKF